MLDVDGVLVRGRPQDGLHFSTDLEKDLGLSVSVLQEKFFKPYWSDIVTGRQPLVKQLKAVLADIAPHLGVETLINYWFDNDARIDLDVLDGLACYRNKGVRVFLATNQEHLRAKYLMETLGLSAHVDGMLYSAALGHRKPSPEFYRLATGKVDALPSDIVLIDDTPANVEAATAFGWNGVHWSDGMSLEQAIIHPTQ
jgi:putative hydrolase of the HAD superfamily